MKPPVEYVKVSAKGREILIRIKRNTGLEHWNEICRIALCRSLANPTPPPKFDKPGDSAIDMDWKTFAGPFSEVLAAIILLRAKKDGINTKNISALSEHFRSHIERGVLMLQNIRTINDFHRQYTNSIYPN